MSERDTETSVEDEIAAEMTDDEIEDAPDERLEAYEDPGETFTGDPEQESQARIEAIGKKLDGFVKYGAKRMGDILGEDATMYRPCMCSEFFQTPGWLPPIDPPVDVQGFMYHWLGQHAPSDYMGDTHSKTCPHCAGFGQVATGSKAQGQEYLTCVECTGNGWIPVDETRKPKYGTAANGGTATYPAPSNETSAVPEPAAPLPPEVALLRQLGYAVIPPMVVGS